MPRGKNWLPTVSRQFLTLNYPRPNCLLKCLLHCLFPTREDFFSSFKIAPVVRVIARQLSGKNCLAAIFASRHQDASQGLLGGKLGVLGGVPGQLLRRLPGLPLLWGSENWHSSRQSWQQFPWHSWQYPQKFWGILARGPVEDRGNGNSRASVRIWRFLVRRQAAQKTTRRTITR